MTILSNRKFRDDLANQDIKIVNDLTKNQAGIAVAAKRDGKVALQERQTYCETKTTRFQDLRPGCSRGHGDHNGRNLNTRTVS